MERAIKHRDQRCVWPACAHSQHLNIHHIKHWANGGVTSVENAACLCSHHHTLVHEGGYTIERVENSDQRLNEQFAQQQRADDVSLFKFEKDLRNDDESFNNVRNLSPTSYRFRVVDAQGLDIRDCSNAGVGDGFVYEETESTFGFDDSTRVECAEPAVDYFYDENHSENLGGKLGRNHRENKERLVPLFIYETPAHCTTNTNTPSVVHH